MPGCQTTQNSWVVSRFGPSVGLNHQQIWGYQQIFWAWNWQRREETIPPPQNSFLKKEEERNKEWNEKKRKEKKERRKEERKEEETCLRLSSIMRQPQGSRQGEMSDQLSSSERTRSMDISARILMKRRIDKLESTLLRWSENGMDLNLCIKHQPSGSTLAYTRIVASLTQKSREHSGLAAPRHPTCN